MVARTFGMGYGGGMSHHWTAAALCAQADPELWFPRKGQSGRRAKAICGVCPVRAECLGEALERDARYGGQHGVWGGYDEGERRAMRRQARTVREPAAA